MDWQKIKSGYCPVWTTLPAASKACRQGWQYGTVRYLGTVRYASIFAKKYGTLVRHVFFVMVWVRYVGTVRLFRKGTGTVRWYAFLIKNPRLFAHYAGFL